MSEARDNGITVLHKLCHHLISQVEHTRLNDRRVGVLAYLRGSVLYRGMKGVAWSDASRDMSLFHGDRVATEAKSEAVLRFPGGHEVRLDEESIVVVRGISQRPADALSDALDMDLTITRAGMGSLIENAAKRLALLAQDLAEPSLVVRKGPRQLVHNEDQGPSPQRFRDGGQDGPALTLRALPACDADDL